MRKLLEKQEGVSDSNILRVKESGPGKEKRSF